MPAGMCTTSPGPRGWRVSALQPHTKVFAGAAARAAVESFHPRAAAFPRRSSRRRHRRSHRAARAPRRHRDTAAGTGDGRSRRASRERSDRRRLSSTARVSRLVNSAALHKPNSACWAAIDGAMNTAAATTIRTAVFMEAPGSKSRRICHRTSGQEVSCAGGCRLSH